MVALYHPLLDQQAERPLYGAQTERNHLGECILRGQAITATPNAFLDRRYDLVRQQLVFLAIARGIACSGRHDTRCQLLQARINGAGQTFEVGGHG
jgi:hypothetical protein